VFFLSSDESVFPEKQGELDLRVSKELAQFGYSPATLRQCYHSVETLHDFIQFIGTHQYYSDTVNKSIFLLNLDADYAILSIEELMIREKDFADIAQVALMLKEKPKLDKAKVDDFKKQVDALEKQVLELLSRAKQLIEQIRRESKSREHFFEPK